LARVGAPNTKKQKKKKKKKKKKKGKNGTNPTHFFPLIEFVAPYWLSGLPPLGLIIYKK
jgi:hypothetical protein